MEQGLIDMFIKNDKKENGPLLKRIAYDASIIVISVSVIYIAFAAYAGSLTPPAGPVAPAMHSLQEIYNSLAGGSVNFTGSGLDDMALGGTFTGGASLNYRVQIDAAGTPNTFKWSDDGGTNWNATAVAITGGAQTLNNGVAITFGAATGHTLGDRWDFYRQAAKNDGNVLEILKCITNKMNGGVCS